MTYKKKNLPYSIICMVLALFIFHSQSFAETPADKSIDQTADNSADQTADKSADQTTDKSADQTTDQSADQTADKSIDQTADKSTDQTTDKSIDQTTDKSTDQTADKSTDQTSNTVGGKKAVTNLLPKTSRAVGKFNVAIYQMFIHPFGTAYGKVMPKVVDKKLNDVLDWSYGPYYMVNDILMGDMGKLANNTGAFLINGTVGLLGVFNVSSKIDINQSQDNLLGTLHTWGLQDHIYVQLPFVGPQTDLTMVSLLTSSFLKPATWLAPSSTIRPGDTVFEHVIYTRNILEYGELTVNVSHGLNMLQSIPGEKDILLRDAWLSMHNLYIDGESAYDIDLEDEDPNDSFGESDF